MAITTLFHTIVKNVSSKTHYFSFLPKHGRRLAPGETYEFAGDLASMFNGTDRLRKAKALEIAMTTGKLEVRQTPTIQMVDLQTGLLKSIAISGGSVIATSEIGSSEDLTP